MNTMQSNSMAIAGLTDVGTSVAMSAATGNLRETVNGLIYAVGESDNASASPGSVTNSVSVTTGADWAAVAVELARSSCGGTPGWMLTGFGQ
jgi:hypothetical protein